MATHSASRILTGAAILAAAVAVMPEIAAQTPPRRPRPSGAKTWHLQHTVWGDPDMQGTWSSSTKAFPEDRVGAALRDGDTGAGPEHWYESTPIARVSQLQIVEPAGSGVPPMTPAGSARAAAITAQRDGRPKGPEDFSSWDRCITRGLPGSMVPITYNNNYQFLQMPGYVVIVYEMIHDARIIPLDGRPHVSPRIRQWMGDSRGHWEGDTLVVEVTNFTDKTHVVHSDGFHTESLRLVERFTRTGRDSIDYQFTVEDPATWTRPWTAAIPLMRIEDRLFEYACHEGNMGLRNMLSAARAEDARDEAAPKSVRPSAR